LFIQNPVLAHPRITFASILTMPTREMNLYQLGVVSLGMGYIFKDIENR